MTFTQGRVEANFCGYDFSEVLLLPECDVSFLKIFWLGFDAAARLCLVLADESNIVVRQ